MTKTPQRPRDVNQWAKRMVDIATVDDAERKEIEEKAKKPKDGKFHKAPQTPGR